MNYNLTVVSLSIIISFVLIFLGSVTLYLAFWGMSRRKISSATEFILFLLSVSIYVYGYAVEVSYRELTDVLFAVKIQYIGIPYITYFAVLFCYRFLLGKPFNKSLSIVMLIIPIMTTLFVFTSEYHELMYINPHIGEGMFFPVFTFEQGVFYKIRFVYQQLISLGSLIFLFHRLFIDNKARRPQILALIVAQTIPGILSILYFLGFFNWGIDINPFSSFIVGTTFSVAILKFGLLEIVPEGRVMALDSISEAFILFDRYGVIQDMNVASKDLDFVNLEVGCPLPYKNTFSQRFNKAIKNGKSGFEFQTVEKNNLCLHYKVKIYPLEFHKSRELGYCVIIYDYTDTRNLLEKLEYRANYDALTNIKSRQSVIEEIETEINRANRSEVSLTLILADIDYFKNLNDTYGHIAGDKMLKGVAGVLKSGLRDFDLIGRYGGEEFIIVCPDSNSAGGIKTAERLRELVEDFSINYNGVELKVTCSFGVYTFEGNEEISISDIIDRADKALYSSKEKGRNKVSFLS